MEFHKVYFVMFTIILVITSIVLIYGLAISHLTLLGYILFFVVVTPILLYYLLKFEKEGGQTK